MQTNRRVSERTHDLSSTVDNRSRKLSRLLGERITDRHGNICRTFVNMEETQESCMFCTIASDQDKDTEIILQNDKLVCFRDIYPAAPHHYLVIPREHILSCLSLDKEHVGLVERMADMGKCALREQGITDMKDIRLGFHQPPYTSVDHLHLHVLAPASQISEYMEYKFLPNTQRFIEEQYLLKWLKDSPSRNSIKCAFGVHQTTQKNVLNELMLKLKLHLK